MRIGDLVKHDGVVCAVLSISRDGEEFLTYCEIDQMKKWWFVTALIEAAEEPITCLACLAVYPSWPDDRDD